MTIKEAFQKLSKVTNAGVKNPWFVIRNLGQTFADVADKIEGGGGGGSTVEVVPILESGTKIATISVDDDDYDLYAPAGSGENAWTLVGTQTGTAAQAISGYSEYYIKIAPNTTHIMEVIILASELSSTAVNYRQGGLLASDNYWGCALVCSNASIALGSVVVNGSDVTAATTITVYGR